MTAPTSAIAELSRQLEDLPPTLDPATRPALIGACRAAGCGAAALLVEHAKLIERKQLLDLVARELLGGVGGRRR